MAKGGFKKQPTVWPTGTFIFSAIFKFLTGLIVLGISGFFIFHLKKDHYQIPWQFAALAALGVLTITNVVATTIFFCCRALNPIAVMIIDTLLSLLWAFSAGAIGKGMGKNTIRGCGIWKTTQGMAVCHLFKTVFAFTILGWFAMVCSITIASGVRKRASSHKYQPANPTSLNQTTAYTPQSQIGQTAAPYGQGGTYKAQDK
jgi:hypothetical protein